MDFLKSKKFYLASNSERRINILNNIGLRFEVIGGDFPEDSRETCPEKYVIENAVNKIKSVKEKVEDGIIIACDTIVYYNSTIIEKPLNKEDAKRILRKINGNKHEVISGIALFDVNQGKIFTGNEITSVYFKNMSEEEINEYINTGDYEGKAGGYGIQSIGGLFVKKIDGCYYNVVGFPLPLFYDMLKSFIKEN